MFRNDRPGRSLVALALLALVVLLATTPAQAARDYDYVDGSGMADQVDDPRNGGGGAVLEGDPWGGEQRAASEVRTGDRTPIANSIPSPDAPLWGFWNWLSSFWSFLVR